MLGGLRASHPLRFVPVPRLPSAPQPLWGLCRFGGLPQAKAEWFKTRVGQIKAVSEHKPQTSLSWEGLWSNAGFTAKHTAASDTVLAQ